MKKRDFINSIVKNWAVISLLIIGALQEPLYAEAPKPKYNVLFLMTDQHRPAKPQKQSQEFRRKGRKEKEEQIESGYKTGSE